jgi:signal transduction histidine kinase
MRKICNQHNDNTLSTQIKRVIRNRILLCFLLALIAVIALTGVEFASSSHQVEIKLKEMCKSYESFVISQILINNEDSIQPKLDALHQRLKGIKIIWRKESKHPIEQKLQWKFPFSWIFIYPVTNIDNTKLGVFIVSGSLLNDHELFSDLLKKISLLVIFFLIILIVLYPLGRRIPQQLFINPIDNLLRLLRNQKDKSTEDLPSFPTEINEIKNKIISLLNEGEEHSREVALGQISTQIAHDIRSPLKVIEIEIEKIARFIPEEATSSLINIRKANQRANDMTNNMMSRYRQKILSDNQEILSPEPVGILLESIVSEKRIQASSYIDITLNISQESHQSFIYVNPISFKRALSNLINNSIEAIESKGSIEIRLSKTAGQICISIKDDGCGIPKDKLPQVLEGLSYGKKNGSGLGLTYAINKISAWQGNYSLKSELGEGTQFEIILPQTKPAAWFAKEINISIHSIIVILDDDQYVHDIWDKRFSQDFALPHNLKLVHFHEANDLINYCLTAKEDNVIFLLDYDLGKNQKSGTQLAEELEISSKSFLVTSRYEDSEIRTICQKLNMKIIPKTFSEFTPINLIKKTNNVFIDDEEVMTSLWKECAINAGKSLSIFNDPRDFMRILHLYDTTTQIYLDSSLGGDLRGEDLAKILHENGYQNLTLSTSFPKEHFKKMPWLKDIIGKEPPWN